MEKMTVNLVDQAGTVRPVRATIKNVNGAIFICPDGYGDACSADGHGDPIMVEVYDGRVRVLVWSDINQEDYTHVIDMEEAREDNREED